VQSEGSLFPGYKGGRTFANDGRAGSQILPPENGPFQEWDVNPYTKGVSRGGERIVTGQNGTAYYTNNHYQSFTQFWGPGQ
jgi:guanyl-specific ribonuclease Sa